MSMKAIGREDYKALLNAAADTAADSVLRARSELAAGRVHEIIGNLEVVMAGDVSFIWSQIHDDSKLLQDMLDVFISARTGPPFGENLLTFLLNQRVKQLRETRQDSALGQRADIFKFVPMRVGGRREPHAKQRATFQLASGLATYYGFGEWGTNRVPLNDSYGGELFHFYINFPVEKNAEPPLVIVGLEAVGAYKEKFEGTLPDGIDVRLDHEPVPFDPTRTTSGITLDHVFPMGPHDPSRLLSVRAFGKMNTVAFLHSARALLPA